MARVSCLGADTASPCRSTAVQSHTGKLIRTRRKPLPLFSTFTDPHLADLPGGGNVGSSVGLLVEAVDVDDPDLLDLRRDQVLRGSHDVGVGHRLRVTTRSRMVRSRAISSLTTRSRSALKPTGTSVRLKSMRPSNGSMFSRSPARQCPVHHPAHHMQTRMGAHQLAPPDVIQASVDDRSDRGQRVALSGHQTRGGDAVDAGEHPPTQAGRRRPAGPASGVEGGLIENDDPRLTKRARWRSSSSATIAPVERDGHRSTQAFRSRPSKAGWAARRG